MVERAGKLMVGEGNGGGYILPYIVTCSEFFVQTSPGSESKRLFVCVC